MNKDHILRLIGEYNPHLRGEQVDLPEYRRELHEEIGKWNEMKQAVAVSGLRRTGKTTLLRQIMEECPEKKALFSFDEESVQDTESLIFILDHFTNSLNAKVVFLDEIHYVRDWEGVLKRYYDQKGLKFFLSGSESMELSKAKAPMAGRLTVFHLGPLGFREYLALRGCEQGSMPAKTPLDDHGSIEAQYERLNVISEYFEKEFTEYIFKGAFPELVGVEDQGVVTRYIQETVVKKIIYRDIPDIFEIRRRPLLYDLFRYASANTARMFDVRNLSRDMGADHQTVSNYLFYLRSAFLVKISESYTRSASKRMRRSKKLHTVHPSLAIAAMGYGREALVENLMGQYVETAFATDMFWRDKRKREVDVIIDGRPPIPVEVKYSGRVDGADLKHLRHFMGEFGAPVCLVVSRDVFRREKVDEGEALVLPAWLYAGLI